ncbi:MAG: ABC transporter ATP-binding protein [Chloroflexi bacterium]|nr:ABC transporter ATP-binding protein [Chloroflexota bacterium]
MIHLHGLQKRFGHKWVLREIDLDIPLGQFVSLFGPNGAGKSTLLRILATLSSPTGGQIAIGGYDPRDSSAHVRRLIGYVAHSPMLYGDLSAEENLRFFSRLYDVAAPEARITELLQLVNLNHRRADRVRTFSRGMQQRLAIARALLADPPVLLLDEPDDGLDPQAAEQMHEYFRGSRTIVMVSHNLYRGLALADRIIMLARGRITFDAAARGMTIGELEGHYRRFADAAN